MGKSALLAIAALLAVTSTASAQQLATNQSSSCQKLTASNAAYTEREGVYLRAACVAARAGIASPANGPLSREELMSILMLMSIQRSPATHAS